MKTKIRKHATSFISIVICAAILLGLPAQALAFDLTDTKWSFMRLSIATTGETLSEAHSLDETDELIRAYNPYTERAVLSFAVENTQPYAVEVWTRNGDDGLYDTDPRETLAGYLKGKYENPESESVFDGTTARYFKGYDGLLQTLIDVPEPEPYPDVNSKNFINVIEWDGEVVDGDGAPVTLSDNVEYVIVLQPLTPVPSSEPDDTEDPENLEESEDTDETEDTDESDDPEESPELPPPDGYLAVKIDRALPPKGLGAPTGASAPFNALSSLPGQHNINMVTGNYVYNNVDLAVAGPQLLAFTRTYNSTDGQSGILGAGWRTNYDYSLEVS
ncbi:MAG: DUF6531 domain-containing protein, partial [Oscillospiraceae bacterium]|nr:DUF6531 domain-containing protein [Oscillospiraceae bacterium]